jgi:A/G-specific adenine glycosylase
VTSASEARETPASPGPAVEELLLAWFAHSGRDLPWRRTRDAYSILVSEVMLQQTQVDRVVPRYERWLDRWPTVEALAEASSAAVIVEWQGLGYNRRAVSLHRAARHVAAEGWPADLTVLPGVGPYTAAAVRNFAFGEDVMPRDVNVERVERRTAHAFAARSAQAVMDLGATTCLARIPRCGTCPLASACPSRGVRDAATRKQSPFEGSFRQRRAAVLRTVAAASRGGEGMETAGLDEAVVGSLVRDGLVSVDGDRVRLPD